MGKRAKQARRTSKYKRANGAGGELASLPALASLTELPAFDELRPHDEQVRAFELAATELSAPDEVELGCVVRLDRGFPAVLTRDDVFRAEFAARLTKGSFSRVAIGDWVCVRKPHGHDMGLIERILPRTSDIARWKGGSRGERQTLAANVDTVIVAQAIEEWRMSAGRVARSAVVALDCGAKVAVVLTKAATAAPEVRERAIGLVHDVLGDVCPVVAVDSLAGDAQDIDAVRALVPAHEVAIMLGPSGVGKSTLLNALLGKEALQTGAVRASDGAGRHTTVTRRMVSIPKAGVIVDAPGLRTLQLVGHERGLALVFPDIAEAAGACKFRDCTHTHEPGCEVRARFGERGTSARLDTYLTLAAEMRESAQTLDPDIVL